MIRAFLALPLPDELAALLVPVQAALLLPRPVPRQDFHVTLAFLGDQPEPVLEELDLALSSTALKAPALAVSGLGGFGAARPRSVHATLRADPALEQLQARVARTVRGAGIALEKRRFLPHVTLGRGEVADVEALARRMERLGAVTSPAFTAPRLGLYRSFLRPEGPLYDLLADYPLIP